MERQNRNQTNHSEGVVEARHVVADLPANSLDHPDWALASAVRLTRYWSGVEAPECRHAEARLLWSADALHLRFSCRQMEPLVVGQNPQTDNETIGLWDRDVCEIFIAPDQDSPDRYFEFEAAPTGEWVDLAIKHRSGKRETDFEFDSGMTAAGRILPQDVMVAMRIPWEGLTKRPQLHERWLVNLFRCVGSGDNRGYIAWRPTRTSKPDFHVPEVFGELRFS